MDYTNSYINIDGNNIHYTAIIYENVILGKGNRIGPYCVIGGNGEIRGADPNNFRGKIIIGDNNIISEHVTIQVPYEDGKITQVGDNNIIMAHSHIGHDAQIGNNTEICTSTVLGGYCKIEDGCKIKLKSVIRNRIIVGSNSIVGMGSVVTKNVNPNSVVYGNPAKEHNK
jgi:UDP-N-acetylglucosamine acyltransferase